MVAHLDDLIARQHARLLGRATLKDQVDLRQTLAETRRRNRRQHKRQHDRQHDVHRRTRHGHHQLLPGRDAGLRRSCGHLGPALALRAFQGLRALWIDVRNRHVSAQRNPAETILYPAPGLLPDRRTKTDREPLDVEPELQSDNEVPELVNRNREREHQNANADVTYRDKNFHVQSFASQTASNESQAISGAFSRHSDTVFAMSVYLILPSMKL